MENIKLIIFDLIGTLTVWNSDEVFPECIKSIKTQENNGLHVAIVSNQGGPACHDYYPKPNKYPSLKEIRFQLSNIQRRLQSHIPFYVCYAFPMRDKVKGFNGIILPDDTSDMMIYQTDILYRKPSPLMLQLAMKDHSIINPKECLFIGAHKEDELCACEINMPFLYRNDFFLTQRDYDGNITKGNSLDDSLKYTNKEV